MTASLAQPRPTNRLAGAASLRLSPSRAESLRAPLGLCCAALGFFCFIPYPALTVGNSSALQIGNLLALAMTVPALFVPWKGRPFWIFPLLAAPLCLSAVKVAMTGDGALDLCLKALAVWGVSFMAVLTGQLYAPRYALNLLTGIAVATLVHVAVGLLQFISFRSGHFPLVALYVNPSFLSVQDNAGVIARYIQRPFGLFPEPSAMSASLGPWVVCWFALASGTIRLWERPAAWQRALFLAASAGGLGLIIISRSGHAAVVTAAVAGFVGIWLARARATPRTVIGLCVGVGVFLPVVLYLAAVSVGDRLGGKSELGNSSWAERAESLEAGFDLLATSDAPTAFLGAGAGMMSPALKARHGLDAVFSVLLTYVFETGFFGALAAACVGFCLLRVWALTRYDLAFAAVAFVWLVGVTVITSYEQLLPIWLTLAWMSVWPSVCRPAEPRLARVAARRGEP